MVAAKIIALTLIGGILRFVNPLWDGGGNLHPDEALIIHGAKSITFFSNLFPGFHDYNGFSVYLLAGVLAIFDTKDHSTTLVIARGLSAGLSTLTLPILFFIGKRLWNNTVGLFASVWYCFLPLSIQLAHFYTTDTVLVFLFSLLLLSIVSFHATHPIRSVLLMSIPAGLLLATKNTALLFLPLPVWYLLVTFGKRCIAALVLFSSSVLIIVLMASPYTFLDYSGYLTRYAYLSDVVSGKLLMDWTMQFQDTNGLFWIPNLLFAFGVVAVVGMIGVVKVPRKRSLTSAAFLFSLWSLLFMLFLAGTYLKFIRYAAPLAPLLSLFAAFAIYSMRLHALKPVVVPTLLLTHVFYGVMFTSIYTAPHTSLQASSWIAAHIDDNSRILVEEWNSIIRFTRPELISKNLSVRSFNFYTLPDSNEKQKTLSDILKNTDYIIIESPKVKHTILRLTSRYPHMTAFYHGLDSGSLGFVRVAFFSSYPTLGPLTLNDETAEETFTVFDHPAIRIYKRSDAVIY